MNKRMAQELALLKESAEKGEGGGTLQP
jgi:hypothetical protein